MSAFIIWMKTILSLESYLSWNPQEFLIRKLDPQLHCYFKHTLKLSKEDRRYVIKFL